MKIFLTGIAGFIGSHLATRLLARGDTIVGLDNFDETLYPRARHEENLAAVGSSPDLTFVEGNIGNRALLDQLFSAHRFDVAVHLAALAGVRPSIVQPERYQTVNIAGTLNILEACRKHNVTRLVFASSSSVYGAHSTVPFSEREAADRPASPYAATKRAGELFCSNYTELYDIGTTCLRFFTVYGPRQRPEMAIAKFARLIQEGHPVQLFGDGNSARDYTFIDDIIDGVVAAIDKCQAKQYRVYNLGGAQTTKLIELVRLLEQAIGKSAVIDWQPDQPGDVPITYADVTLANHDLHYRPKIDIKTGIARFIKGSSV